MPVIGKRCEVNRSGNVLYWFAVKSGKLDFTTDFFLTARGTQPWYRVAWGFFATSVGAGAIFSIASFVTNPIYGGGYIGLIMYSFFAGFPLILISVMGKDLISS